MPRINQRVKILSESLLADGVTFGDITGIHGDGYISVKTINPNTTERYETRLSPSDWTSVPGRPVFAHIDGERPGSEPSAPTSRRPRPWSPPSPLWSPPRRGATR